MTEATPEAAVVSAASLAVRESSSIHGEATAFVCNNLGFSRLEFESAARTVLSDLPAEVDERSRCIFMMALMQFTK